MAQHAAGPLGAARIAARRPDTDATQIRERLAQVAELAALLITDDSIRAEPVPDIAPALELLDVPGSALDAVPLAELTVALAAMRVVAADLNRLRTTHDARRTDIRTEAGAPIVEISAVTRQGIQALVEVLWKMLKS